ncbi:putative NADH:ubiquinone reductase (H(+)-translocating) [Helianthus anomalus]
MPLFLLSLEWRFKMRKSGLGVMPKIPGFLKLWRLRCPSRGVCLLVQLRTRCRTRLITCPFYTVFSQLRSQIFFFCSIASMILGALAAMAQTKVKRLLAHSSIGHVGYIRTGFSCGTIERIQSLLIGIFIYASMMIDAFAIVSALRQSRVKWLSLRSYSKGARGLTV